MNAQQAINGLLKREAEYRKLLKALPKEDHGDADYYFQQGVIIKDIEKLIKLDKRS